LPRVTWAGENLGNSLCDEGWIPFREAAAETVLPYYRLKSGKGRSHDRNFSGDIVAEFAGLAQIVVPHPVVIDDNTNVGIGYVVHQLCMRYPRSDTNPGPNRGIAKQRRGLSGPPGKHLPHHDQLHSGRERRSCEQQPVQPSSLHELSLIQHNPDIVGEA
jgi:hypothetical protein